MPTEAEWHALRDTVDTDQPYWARAPGKINLEYYASSCPVNRHEFPGGFYDIIGNVWQWTETPVDACEGFEVHPAYDDFSTPTFDGKHNIFKGEGAGALRFTTVGVHSLEGSSWAQLQQLTQPTVDPSGTCGKPPCGRCRGQEHSPCAGRFGPAAGGPTPSTSTGCTSEMASHRSKRSSRRLTIWYAAARSATTPFPTCLPGWQ
jgi:hypothetical protein